MIEEFDVVVLGSGEAGKYLAWTLAESGLRTAMVERRWIGGSCPNIACLPTKNVIYSAKVASLMRRSAEFGLSAGEVHVDMEGVRARKRRMVDALVQVHQKRYASSGTELVLGQGTFVAPRTLQVALSDGGSRTLRGAKVILSTGSRATIPDLPGMKEAAPMTHIEALELDVVPDHLLVLGGGYIGLELAQAMRRFGARVTIVERNRRVLPREDDDAVAELTAMCQREGIDVVTGVELQRVEGRSGEEVSLFGLRDGAEFSITGSHLLASAGRTPNTDGIGLEAAGVALTERGFIRVNERLETTAENTWAVGDCAGSPQFTHAAFDDFRIVRDNLRGGNRSTRDRLMPFSLFTDPEFARVGLSENEARQQGIPYRLVKIPMAAVLRTRTLGEETGFLKALLHAENDSILGFTAVGVEAGEILGVVELAMRTGAPYTAIRDAVLPHPTMAEGLTVLFGQKPVLHS
ncbi:dihydrolipoyl dehydrogenase family protein [Terriglobus sp. ADX1]|uniref:dihydrolipoyl dehydrogenase family protein n=1 Tax=Terriglobus sp. ADX1 TaxID=2794063 RepID=UPI002FE550FC